ncbi:MAG: Hpt domain-containing protein [Chthoniobacterales bacterium]
MSSLLRPPDAFPAISSSAIAELRSMDEGSPPLIFLELVQLFRDSTPQLLSQACDALTAPAELALIAHSLKGSCSNFGAHIREKLCFELEQLARANKSDHTRELIGAIEQEYFRVRAALAEHCARVDSPTPPAIRRGNHAWAPVSFS